MAPRIIYTPKYDLHFMGIEKLHPFDGRKYSRSWNLLHEKHGTFLEEITTTPERLISDEELCLIHPEEYLIRLNTTKHVVVKAIELKFLNLLPLPLLKARIIDPMLLGAYGTLLAADACLETGIAVNFSGGYHHASRDKASGYCLVSDIGIAIEYLRNKGIVTPERPAMIIDLDAHQGNGHERVFHGIDDYVYIVDMYNEELWPWDDFAKERINYQIPVQPGITTTDYLNLLCEHLTLAFAEVKNPSVVIYNAGTDIYTHDKQGKMLVTPDGVFERDKFVLDTCRAKGIPCIMVPSGGYSSESYKFLARTVDYLISLS